MENVCICCLDFYDTIDIKDIVGKQNIIECYEVDYDSYFIYVNIDTYNKHKDKLCDYDIKI